MDLKSCVFSPLSNLPGLEKGHEEISICLDTSISMHSANPKETFLENVCGSSFIQFHGNSQFVEHNPLKQHLDFTGYATTEDERKGY
jgi:hypothetical protein